jgi:hypothetical protein
MVTGGQFRYIAGSQFRYTLPTLPRGPSPDHPLKPVTCGFFEVILGRDPRVFQPARGVTC